MKKFIVRSGTAALTALAMCVASAVAAPPAALVLGTATVGQEGVGTIKGRLVYGGATAPGPRVLRAIGKAEKDPAFCAAKAAIPSDELDVDPKSLGISYGVAYLVKPKGEFAAQAKVLAEKTPSVEIDQKNCRFTPFLTALSTDQAIKFKSSDAVGHNVHLAGFNNLHLRSTRLRRRR